MTNREIPNSAESASTCDGLVRGMDFPFSAIATAAGMERELPRTNLAKSGAECSAYHSSRNQPGREQAT